MAYSSLTNKLLLVGDDLYTQMVLKKFQGSSVEEEVCFDTENAPAFMQAGDISDRIITDLNIPQISR
jgi:hypothetical protein